MLYLKFLYDLSDCVVTIAITLYMCVCAQLHIADSCYRESETQTRVSKNKEIVKNLFLKFFDGKEKEIKW